MKTKSVRTIVSGISMAKTLFLQNLIRRNSCIHQNPYTQIRNLTVEVGEKNHVRESNFNHNQEAAYSQDFFGIAKQVSKAIRSKPRWEQTLFSQFPSFNFHDPLFLREILKHQNNVFLSLRFFIWLSSYHQFSPDPLCCSNLFDALVKAKACNAAKYFLDHTGFSPEPASLEGYIQCLCDGGLVEEAVDMVYKLKEVGFCPSIGTWNLALLGSLKVGRTDLIWKLYQEMVESGVQADIDVETVGYLIQAFCSDKNVSKAYELLRQVLEDGLAPDNSAFNKLISGFCERRDYTKVSELLHIMIAKNRAPDVFTYQEVINGLCKKRKRLEGFRVFNDLKHRGYAPDRVMYTTMIHGLCEMGWLGEARKLWFEMIEKGCLPNEYTYNALIHGFYKIGDFEEASKVYKEMCDRGYGETTVSYNTMISGLCLHGWIDEAHDLFREMTRKGINRDLITYNTLIQGFCKEGKIDESTNLFKELLEKGLQPSTSTYTPLIENHCQQGGNVKEAKKLWSEMQNRGLEPMVCSHDHIIGGLCNEGYVEEGMEWLVTMLKNKLKPNRQTFERLIQCLLQTNRLDDSLLTVDFMLRIGYFVEEGIFSSLVNKLCQDDSHLVESFLEKVVEIN